MQMSFFHVRQCPVILYNRLDGSKRKLAREPSQTENAQGTAKSKKGVQRYMCSCPSLLELFKVYDFKMNENGTISYFDIISDLHCQFSILLKFVAFTLIHTRYQKALTAIEAVQLRSPCGAESHQLVTNR